MSEIKYEDIYYMLKDVAFDQEYPTEAYKKIAKEITKVETERDRYKAEVEYEHRRRVAAEKMIIEPEALSQEGYLDMIEYKKDYDEWQSIIKEVGE